MTNALVDFKSFLALPLVWFASLEVSLEGEPKKGFFRQTHWRFNRKAKCLTVVALTAVLLISVFAFLPKQNLTKANVGTQNTYHSTATQSPTSSLKSTSTSPPFSKGVTTTGAASSAEKITHAPGLIETAQTINSTVWMEVAANAWTYFQPSEGVYSFTGLPLAGTSFPGFTDWDLGCYIQAIIDAQELNLTTTNGVWGSSNRINMVLTFLENRPLDNDTGYPFQFYNATSGDVYNITQETGVDIADTGRLFVALNNLISFNSSLKQPIDNLVYNKYGNRSNYATLVPAIVADSQTSTNIYSYYVYSGFADFFASSFPGLSNVSNKILTNILSAPVTYSPYGDVSLNEAHITGDPLLLSIFELNNNDPRLLALSKQVYLASEDYYNATGQYCAFSEGTGPDGTFVDEWVVLPSGDTWKITEAGGGPYLNIEPIIYNKVAFSFLALYNTTYARNMLIYLEQNLPEPSYGYTDGATNGCVEGISTNGNGEILSNLGSDTNQLILDAAVYAIQNNP